MNQQHKLRNSLRAFYDAQKFTTDNSEWERTSLYISRIKQRRRIQNYALLILGLLSSLFLSILILRTFVINNEHQIKSRINKDIKLMNIKTGEIQQTSELSLRSLQIKNQVKHSDVVYLNSNADINSVPQNLGIISEANNTIYRGTLKQVNKSTNSNSLFDYLKDSNEVNEKKLIFCNYSTTSTTNINNIQKKNKIEIKTEDVLLNTKKSPINLLSQETLIGNGNSFRTDGITQMSKDTLVKTNHMVTLNTFEKEIKMKEIAKISLSDSMFYNSSLNKTSIITYPKSEQNKLINPEDTLTTNNPSTQMATEGVFYELGTAWFYGWKGSLKREAQGFSPLVGVNYMNVLSKRSALSFGAQYLFVQKLYSSSKTSRISNFSYGEQSKITTITPFRLHYILAPLRFHFYLNHQNIIGGGINLAYLLTVDAIVSKYDEKPGYIGNLETTKLSGYTDGFSWFDSQLSIFYEKKIGRSIGIHAEFFVGLTDVKQNDFFGISKIERNSGAKISLIYYGFRKNKKK